MLTDDKISMMHDTIEGEISYAVSTEYQTRSRTMQKLSKTLNSQMHLMAESSNELIAAEAEERAADMVKVRESLQAHTEEESLAAQALLFGVSSY
jgi:hypothetical protein